MLQLSKEDIEAIADAVAARSRHASGAQPDSACDEIGWLVEITGPRYWTGTPGCGNWTADSRAAMRFARRQDAEAACRHLAPSGAIPVEHAWVSHRPAGAQPSGAPYKSWIERGAEFEAATTPEKLSGAHAPAPLGTLPAFHTLEECRDVFRRVTKRGPCLSSEDLHGIAAIRDFLTLTPEQFRENWGPREDDDEKCEGGECRHGFDPDGGEYLLECQKHGGKTDPASAQGEVCECGHIAAIHDDPHGDGAHGGSCLEIIGKCSDGSDDFCCCSEFHHAQ